jgi:hypothetical protein
MTEALQQVIEQMQQLAPALQDQFAVFIQQKLDELKTDPRTQAAIERLHAEWDATLPEQLARIERGEHDSPVYHSEEEFLRSLGATDEELAEFEREVAEQER